MKITSYNSNFIYFLRILSAWMVLLGHAFSMFQVSILKDNTYFPYIQNIGVVILFFVSGYCNMQYLEKIVKRGGDAVKSFLSKRTLRIYRGFIPALVLTFFLDLICIRYVKFSGGGYEYYQNFNVKTFIGNLFMLQDHPIPRLLGWDKIVISSFGSGRPFWSLAVEWWIYVGMACCCFYYYDMKHHDIGISKVIICGICSFVAIYNLVGGRGNGLTFIWILGAVAYKATKKIKVGSKQILRLSEVLLSGIIIIYGTWVNEEYDILFSGIIVVSLYIILAWGEGERTSKCKYSKLLKNISGYTYSLYLVHYGILKMIVNLQWEVSSSVKLIVGVTLSNVIAIFFAYLFENNKVIALIKR